MSEFKGQFYISPADYDFKPFYADSLRDAVRSIKSLSKSSKEQIVNFCCSIWDTDKYSTPEIYDIKGHNITPILLDTNKIISNSEYVLNPKEFLDKFNIMSNTTNQFYVEKFKYSLGVEKFRSDYNPTSNSTRNQINEHKEKTNETRLSR